MMVVWLRPKYILALYTSLYFSSELVLSKTYEKFWCSTEEGHHQLSCPDPAALLTDVSIRKVYRRTQMCEPDHHSEYLVYCQSSIDGSLCEGNKTCSIEISSRDYLLCHNKTYAPTYFLVKYACTQIHKICVDKAPIRNTLYGYIVSPGYPHPMADNLTCSITIEADPSMYIELSPIQIHLHDGFKCRSEYVEVFGYDSPFDDSNYDKTNSWKSYYTWCGADHSPNNPIPNARYLIRSNSVYISLGTGTFKKPRYVKIRYKIVPSIAHSQYNSDGIALDSMDKGYKTLKGSSTSLILSISTTPTTSSSNDSDIMTTNDAQSKRKLRKEILIGIITGIIALVVAIIVGIVIFILLRKRRASSTISKKPSTSITTNTTLKSSDKAPLLEQSNNKSAEANKRKLIPERTVQIAETQGTRFKSNESTGSKLNSAKSDLPPAKPALNIADSGIYGADLTEDKPIVTKSTPSVVNDPPIGQCSDLPTIPEATTIVDVNVSVDEPLLPAVINSDNIEVNKKEEVEIVLIDTTIQSAYPNLIDATTSENEGTICGSISHSRRESDIKQEISSQELNPIETSALSDDTDQSSYNLIPFNPLHVILKRDANKYYTTEYI